MIDNPGFNDRFPMIPEKYRHAFCAINDEVSMLHAVWNSYKLLFAGNRSDFDNLNRVAPAFASMVQISMQDEVFLRLSRLTDPASQGSKNKPKINLTLESLGGLAEMTMQTAIENNFRALILKMSSVVIPLREHRNKRIAHSDYETLLGKQQLPPLPMDSIEAALHILREIMNDLNHFYQGGSTAYETPIVSGDSDSLLYCVRDGLRLRSIRKSESQLNDCELRRAILERQHQ